MAVTGRRRKKFIRDPERASELVFRALSKLREDRGESFKATVPEIMAEFPNVIAPDEKSIFPQGATVYRMLNRLESEGKFKRVGKAGRGRIYTYDFSDSVSAVPAAAIPTDDRTVMVDGTITALLEEDRRLTAQIDDLMTKLRSDVERKRAIVAEAEKFVEEGILVTA